MEPHPQQLGGREDEDAVRMGKEAFAHYTQVAEAVHANLDPNDLEGAAAREAAADFAAKEAELDALLADDSSSEDDDVRGAMAMRRAPQDEQELPEPEPEAAPVVNAQAAAARQQQKQQEQGARQQVEALYRAHNPEKLPQVEALCLKYGEAALLQMVQRKYCAQAMAPVTEVAQGLRMIQQVYSLAPMVVGKMLPTRCSPRLRLFFEGADEALVAAMSSSGGGGGGGSNAIASVPGAWLSVLAKVEAALDLSVAERVLVRRHDNGFFANFLQVMDALAASITALSDPAESAAGPESGSGSSSAREVAIDWTLDGTEEHFTYGDKGDDVWSQLFEPITPPVTAAAAEEAAAAAETKGTGQVSLSRRLNMLLCSVYRGMTTGEGKGGSSYFGSQRYQYHALYAKHIKLRHPALLRGLAEGRSALAAAAAAAGGGGGGGGGGGDGGEGVYKLAVHKRVSTPAVINAQSAQTLPSTAEYIAAARKALATAAAKNRRSQQQQQQHGGDGQKKKTDGDEEEGEEGGATAAAAAAAAGGGGGVIWLASDDAEAVDAFKAEFGDRCVVRGAEVKRTTGGVCEDGRSNEVHNLAGGATIMDAVDVLIDALMMSECDECIHADSNVTIAAAIFNPSMAMTHILSSLGGGSGSSGGGGGATGTGTG
jgi:hypothetical protein